MNRRRRGFTLVEVMIVVVIIGILSTIGGGALLQLVRSSRVNGSASALSAALYSARVRAVGSNCTHFVQVNGPAYAGVGAQAGQLVVSTVRKGVCSSTNMFFEAGDRLVDSDVLNMDAVRNTLTSGVTGGTVTTEAFTIGYDSQGLRGQAMDTGTGFGVVVLAGDALVGVADTRYHISRTVTAGTRGTPRLGP
jgi:prepilin-type N-terminal cleavage/methylation domain-containing protein